MCAAEDAAKDERFQRKQKRDLEAGFLGGWREVKGLERLSVENVTVRSVGETPTARCGDWQRSQNWVGIKNDLSCLFYGIWLQF
jgi:hypothetical protein